MTIVIKNVRELRKKEMQEQNSEHSVFFYVCSLQSPILTAQKTQHNI